MSKRNIFERGTYATPHDSITSAYFKDVVRIKPKSKEDITRYAKAYKEEVKREEDAQERMRNSATEEERMKAMADINKAKEAQIRYRNIIWESHLLLVVSIVRSYQGQGCKDIFMDLIQDGNTSITQALDTYNPEKNVDFSSYCAWWVRRYVTDYIQNKVPLVKRSVNRIGQTLYTKTRAKLEQELEREPEMDEILDVMNESYTGNNNFTKEMVVEHTRANVDHFNNGTEATTDEMAFNQVTCSYNEANDTLAQDDIKKIVRLYLSRIPEKESRALCMLYGIDQDRAYTYEEIGFMEGKTRQAIQARCDRGKKRIQEMVMNEEREI